MMQTFKRDLNGPRLQIEFSFNLQVWPNRVPDLEEGVGNAHPNHALANQSSQTKGGNNTSSPPRSEHGGDSGDDEEKSVLQVTLHWFASVCQKLNPRCRRSWPTWRSTLGTGGWPSPSSPSSSSSLGSPSTSSITRSVPFHPFSVWFEASDFLMFDSSRYWICWEVFQTVAVGFCVRLLTSPLPTLPPPQIQFVLHSPNRLTTCTPSHHPLPLSGKNVELVLPEQLRELHHHRRDRVGGGRPRGPPPCCHPLLSILSQGNMNPHHNQNLLSISRRRSYQMYSILYLPSSNCF